MGLSHPTAFSATTAEVLDKSADIWDPPAPSKLSEAKPHVIELSFQASSAQIAESQANKW